MYLFLPLLAGMLPLLLVLGVVFLDRYRERREGRRSPLTGKLWNGPGQQLRRELDKSDENLNAVLLFLVLVGPLLLSTWALYRLSRLEVHFGSGEWVFIVVFAVAVLLTAYKSVKLRTKRLRLLEGLKAEQMTAQLLLPLLGKGFQILHDIPAEGFNLDHVVVGSHTVFVVETKSRKKPGRGKQSAQVAYDGRALHFPDHVSSKPVDQARAEADWLRKLLLSATGEAVPVVPVVALPGWYVNPGKEAHRSDVKVINPKMHSVFVNTQTGSRLSAILRSHIVHALVERYPVE